MTTPPGRRCSRYATRCDPQGLSPSALIQGYHQHNSKPSSHSSRDPCNTQPPRELGGWALLPGEGAESLGFRVLGQRFRLMGSGAKTWGVLVRGVGALRSLGLRVSDSGDGDR
mmetsp:Transcript_27167/g.42485  ORF Transcript_27167/g.42485 Transcript_27167/m.42485 type:complete len:113 (-) Transcript_27167:40-378(-)